VEFYCSPTAPYWQDLNQVAPWGVNQEPGRARDPAPSDHPAWAHPGRGHPGAWDRLGLGHHPAWVHPGPGHPGAWDRPEAWDHPAGPVHPAEEDDRQAVIGRK